MKCFFCKGEMTEATTHFTQLDNCFIIIKDVPCSKCVQCSEIVYSGEVASQIERIIDELSEIFTEIAVVNYSDLWHKRASAPLIA